MRFLLSATALLLLQSSLVTAQELPPAAPRPAEAAPTTVPSSPESTTAPAPVPAGPQPVAERTAINLLGQTDTASGESRRNENVQFNLIDNNALKELNIRLGTTATIVSGFQPEHGYFGAEFGKPPERALAVKAPRVDGFHGNLFYSHNNSIFTARSFFQAGEVKPANENHYGSTFSFKAWKGANFTIEGSQQKIRGNVNGNVLVPLANERTPTATDPALYAIVAQYLSAYPEAEPNRTDIDPRMLNTNARQKVDTDRLGGWFDQTLGARDRLTVRYLYTLQKVDAFQFIKGQNPDVRVKSQTYRLNWDRTISPTTLASFTAGLDRLNSILTPEPNAVGPTVSIKAIAGLGPGPTIPIDRTINRFRYAGHLLHTRGKHLVTAGGELVRRQYNGFEDDAHRGIVRFGNNANGDEITNFLAGTPNGYTGVTGYINRGFRNWMGGFYVGDKWSATQNLTLDLSLRWEFATHPYDVNGLSDLPFSSDLNNFGPRAGFAYRLKGRWGVIRGAYGIHYGELFPVTYGNDRLNPPYNYRFVVNDPDLTNLPVDVSWEDIPPGTRSSIYTFNPDLVLPYSQQYNLSWEPELARDVNLQLGYVGSRTWKTFTMWFDNRARPVEGIDQTLRTINQRRPRDEIFENFDIRSASRAYFDAVRATLSVRRDAFDFTASYWFSKAIDLGGDYTTTLSGPDARVNRSQSEFDVFGDVKAVSNFHQPHAFLFQGSYETPSLSAHPQWARTILGSWELGAVLLLKSGTPFTVESGSDAPNFGNVDGQDSDRPNLIHPDAISVVIGHPDTSRQKLPAAAFDYIGPYDLGGNLGRNTFRKGRIANLNASLSRAWTIAAERRLVFRAESINFFNTAQFAEPNTTLTSPSFGRITNTLNDGRTFRFLLRFEF